MNIKFKSILIAAAMLIMTTAANAQLGSFGASDAQTLGVANTGNAYNYGLMSIGKNPALLGAQPLGEEETGLITFQIGLPGLSAFASSNNLTFDDLNAYFAEDENGDPVELTDSDKKAIVDAFSDDGKFVYSMNYRLFGVSWMPSKEIGAFAFTWDYIANGLFVMPQSLVDMMFNGNQPGTSYDFSNMGADTWMLQTMAFSYSREIWDNTANSGDFIQNLSGGVSLKMINGLAYVGTEDGTTVFNTSDKNALSGELNFVTNMAISPDFKVAYDYEEDNDEDPSVGLMPEGAGSGFGFDLGFVAETNIGLTIALAITDIGSITWDNHTAVMTAKGDFFLDDVFKQKDDSNQLDSLEDTFDTETVESDGFDTDLPTALRLGFAYELSKVVDMPGKLMLALDYNQGFNEAPGNSTDPRFSFGARWSQDSPYIPVVSTGFSNDRTGSLRWAWGFGWSSSILDIQLATYDVLSLMSANSNPPHVSVGLGILWKIPY